MTQSRAPESPEVRSFEAKVDRVDGRDVALDETFFYAESGGQPADRGTLGGYDVVDVQERGGRVVHTLADDPDFAEGDRVEGVVDDRFRTYTMRAHTASHVLYGAGRRLLEDVGYGGFDIGDEKVRVDFTTPTEIDDETLVELERLANRAVWESREVSWEQVDAEEARERAEVAFNTKTEEGVMADADQVRVVTVGGVGREDPPGGDADDAEGADDGVDAGDGGYAPGENWDVAACGGTHVSNTEEIGSVAVLDRSNPGEGLTRVEFAVGPSALDRRAEERSAALEAARELGTSVEELPALVRSLREERDEMESELRELKSEALAASLSEFEAVERDGATWRVGSVDGFGPNEVGEAAKEAVADGDADVVAATGRDGSTFVVVASDGAVEAGDVVDEVTDEFGGGGGGGPTFAQGGGLQDDPGAVTAFLRE